MARMTTKLYKAATSGDVGALEEMQKQNINILAQVSHGGDTALHISAFHSRRDFIERLLQHVRAQSDEDENQERSFLRDQNEEENNALYEAMKGGDHAQIVEMLIKVDAELAGIHIIRLWPFQCTQNVVSKDRSSLLRKI
ncbi:hypothetical protein SUGI_0424930 [Cryptomeria japonica]|nr:hypothetical protein SUGI_0424930 [Cryptomeria japonica]